MRTLPINASILAQTWNRLVQRPKDAIEQKLTEKRLAEIVGIPERGIKNAPVFSSIDPGHRLFGCLACLFFRSLMA